MLDPLDILKFTMAQLPPHPHYGKRINIKDLGGYFLWEYELGGTCGMYSFNHLRPLDTIQAIHEAESDL